MTETSTETASRGRTRGLGRVLVVVYAILALASFGRSLVQIIRSFDEAPLAYSLSALSALIYIVATIALISRGPFWTRVAWVTISIELAGVLVVGTLSVVDPGLFNHPSVWSWYGVGYLFVPLALPVLGLLWLRKNRVVEARSTA